MERDGKANSDILELYIISTHTPRVERDAVDPLIDTLQEKSTHTPRVERDNQYFVWGDNPLLFQLTRPVWSVTLLSLAVLHRLVISTHTPRVERDFL